MTYELFYIIPTKYTEDEVVGIRDRVKALLEKNGAKVLGTNTLGKQKLAYPIKKFKFGHEFLVEFEAEAPVIPAAEKELAIESELVRYMIGHKAMNAKSLRVEERTRSVEPRAAQAIKSAVKPIAPTISEEQLEKRIEEVLDEPIV